MENSEIESTLKELLSVVQALSAGQQVLADNQRALADNQTAGFTELNDRLDRIERTLNATFEQVGRTAEDVTIIKADNLLNHQRLDAHRNLIGKIEEEIEMLKLQIKS